MSKVFVVREPPQVPRIHGGGMRPKIDLSPAQKYGSLVYVMEWSEAKDMDHDTLAATIERRMASFTADDYVLLTGAPLAMVLAVCAAARRTGGPVRTLDWDKMRGYVVTEFNPFHYDQET